MEYIKFIHKVSKGSRFNQIYVPKEMEQHFQSGDIVEVTLIERKSNLHYSKGLSKLNRFKENLVKDIFLELKKFKEISQIFIIGSFLTQKQDYNDIDIVLISDKDIEKEVYKSLVDKFELKFHIISIAKDKLDNLLRYCPLTRSMFYNFVSDKEFRMSKESELNKDHLRYLMMMPEDLLKIKLGPRSYYDAIRRLLTIERFLESLTIDPLEINKEIQKLIGEKLSDELRTYGQIDDETIKKLSDIIKSKLDKINKILDKK